MKLSDFVSLETALDVITKRLATSKVKNLDVAKMLARDAVKLQAMDAMRDFVRADIQDMFDGYSVFTHTSAAQEAYEEHVTDYFDGLAPGLCSASFRGTVDNYAPADQAGVETLCSRFADEAWRNLTAHNDSKNDANFGQEKSPGQILSSVGVTMPDLETIIGASAAPEPDVKQKEEVTTMADEATVLAEFREAAEMVGMSEKELRNNLDNASDEDDALAMSGFEALGVEFDMEKLNTLRMLRMVGGVDYIMTAMQDGDSGTVMKNEGVSEIEIVDAPSATVEAPKKSRKKADAPAPDATTGPLEATVIPPQVLATLRDRTGVKAEELGAGLGTSRTTFINYANGKGKLYSNDVIKSYIVQTLDDHINALTAAKHLMNGVQ